jgi:uncharacterized protein (TIGR03083 family)
VRNNLPSSDLSSVDLPSTDLSSRDLDFAALLRLLDERSAAFRAAVEAAPDLGAQVPTCPEWTLLDLADHVGRGRRAWAATVLAGPGATAKAAPADPAPAPTRQAELVGWLAESTRLLLDALAASGPDRGCWTWWGDSQSPSTCGAVARHQLQEVALHTYDAELTVHGTASLPDDVALDGVEEFLSTCNATTSPWPHDPATVDYVVSEGRAWRLFLSGEGARAVRLAEPAEEAADVSAHADAADVVLFMYGRKGVDDLPTSGNREVFDQLIAWEPE